jgi:selenocysteine lyase/cysteine desulfurase
VGAVVADPGLLESLAPDKLVPAPGEVPDRFEQGTLPFADLAGVTAAVEHLASLAGPAAAGTRRERILAGLAAAEAHEQDLFRVLLGGLDAMDHVTTYGKAARRTATAYFTVAGRTPRQVAEHLAGRKVNVWDGDNYAWELAGVPGRPRALQRPVRRRPAARGRGGAWRISPRPRGKYPWRRHNAADR